MQTAHVRRLAVRVWAPWLALLAGCGDSFDAAAPGTGSATSTSGSGAGGAGGATSAATTTDASAASTTAATSGSGGAGGSSCQALGDTCSGCTYAACTDLYCTCYADQDCAGIVACFQSCPPGDQACQQTCMTASPSAISPSFLLGGCAATSCTAECPGTQPLTACTTCLFTSCSAAMNTCLADPECAAILQCAEACPPGDTPCVLGCGAQHPSAQSAALAVQSCGGTNCQPECG